MVNAAVSVIQPLFDDPIVVSIRFRYSTVYADGVTPLPSNLLAASESGIHVIPWNTYVGALAAGGTTTNDTAANASLPGTALSTNVDTASASGRAIGLDTPPVMFADGSLGLGGPYDGIVTINSNVAFTFTRPPASATYDAQRSVEHEIDEVLGLGSSIGVRADLRPQDLFSWSAAGVRSLTSSGSRYFSIDGGATSIVGFNQDPSGDRGDWLSGSCPQTTPFVQNAFSCPDQFSDVTLTSPEGINLDVIGYDLITGSTTSRPTTSTTTTTTLPCPSPQVECCPVGQPGCGVCGTDCGNGGCCPANLPVCDNVNGLCITCAPGQVGCCPVGQPGCGMCGTDCGNGACCPAALPVCDNANGLCVAQAPQCPSGETPCSDAALGFPDVGCCAQPTKAKQCAAACRQIISACKTSCAATTRAKKCKKRCQSAIVGRCKRARPHACS
ncbi:MAG TPA: NF038122 family metalloprotease [Candidatus Eisenbacteria bacterium]|nr:NF038122 family metalloprotease [Candidatus Eisenbacteria bacterium]